MPLYVYQAKSRIDAANAEATEREVLAGLARSGPSVALDLSAVTYISSAGLRVLLVSAKAAKAAGGKAMVVGAQGAVLDVIRMSGFDKIIPLVDSLETAQQLSAG